MSFEVLNGYVRPFVTVLFSGVFCYGFLVKMIGADVFTGVATMVIIYWFKSRDEDKAKDTIHASEVKQLTINEPKKTDV